MELTLTCDRFVTMQISELPQRMRTYHLVKIHPLLYLTSLFLISLSLGSLRAALRCPEVVLILTQ